MLLVKSPKSDAFPVVGIAMKSMVLIRLGDPPPPKQARVGEETPALLKLEVCKSPKSCAFPVDPMVIKSIIVVLGSPPAKTPLVAFDAVPTVPLASVKFSKVLCITRC